MGECRRDRACAGIVGRIVRLWVMTEIWKTGDFSPRVECLIEGKTLGQVRRLGGWKGSMGRVGHGSKSGPRMLGILCINLGRSSLDLGAVEQKGRK